MLRTARFLAASCSLEVLNDDGNSRFAMVALGAHTGCGGRGEYPSGAESSTLERPEAGCEGRAEPLCGGGGAPGGVGAAWAFGRSREAEGAPSSCGAGGVSFLNQLYGPEGHVGVRHRETHQPRPCGLELGHSRARPLLRWRRRRWR